MSALSAPRATPRRSTYYFESDAPAAADAVLWQGALAGLNSSGYLVPWSAATGLKNPCIVDADNGRRNVDMTGLSNGAIQVRIFFGVFAFACGGGGDALTQADVGSVVYGIDDQTIGKVSTGRSAVGKLDRIDADGYWVSLARP